ncbi:hypothetical protein M413DRAFT_26590 [Hebeloma cylindrosporum]|uniref:F-box domain-containing protein n=1 Tax=Hebeloma cylindrosporum TaxID=76867 RepID=A0A0C3C0Y9_HEBCY|nr:hypothetical protein M413DRAFT_26590 [Hebeloma cylindrosporum h7]
MDILPLEILSLILDEIAGDDHDDLLSCLLVCKSFEILATPHAFRVLILSEDKGSRDAFFNIAKIPRLAELVKKIDFTYEDNKTAEHDDWYGDHRDDEEIREISEIFSKFHQFPHLKQLVCEFPDEFQSCDAMDDGTSRCLSLQMKMFEKFAECCSDTAHRAQNKSQLRSIKLDGMLPVAHSDGRGLRSKPPGLPVFFQSIQIMNLTLRVEDTNSDTFYESGPYLDFWRIDMLNLVSMPAASLSSFSLFNNVRTVGFDCPTWDSLTFPNLRHLHLDSIVFNDHEYFNRQETGVEAFIVRHAPTLRHLDLSHCLINLGNDPFYSTLPLTPRARTWVDICQLFDEKLTKVKVFTLTPTPNLAKGSREGYVHWCDGCYI